MIFTDEDMLKMAEWLLARYTRRLDDHGALRLGPFRIDAAARDAMHMLKEKLAGEPVDDRAYEFTGPIR